MDQERDQLEDMTDMEEALQESNHGTRGLTLATKADDGVKYFIEFNSKGHITPKSIRNKVVKWQGTLAKLLVPLSTYEKWTNVCKTLKKNIWERFLVGISSACIIPKAIFCLIIYLTLILNLFLIRKNLKWTQSIGKNVYKLLVFLGRIGRIDSPLNIYCLSKKIPSYLRHHHIGSSNQMIGLYL